MISPVLLNINKFVALSNLFDTAAGSSFLYNKALELRSGDFACMYAIEYWIFFTE